MVIAVKCEGWPGQASAAWLQEGSASGWPGQEKVRHIKSQGFQLVAKSHDGDEQTDTLWRLSFALAEASLFDHIDSINDIKMCHKKLLVILKCIRKLVMSSGSGTTPIFTSYMLKTLLYHQCFRYPNPQDWTKDKLGERFQTAVEALYDNMEQESLSHFFVPGVNLFEGRGVYIVKKTVKAMRDNAGEFIKNLEKSSWNNAFGHGLYKFQ